MKNTTKALIAIVITAIIAFGALSYLGTRENNSSINRWTEKINQNSQKIEQVREATQNSISAHSELINDNANAIADNAGLIADNAGLIADNAGLIANNTTDIQKLQKTQAELKKIVWAHGAKTNRVVKLFFRLAYGSSAETQKRIFDYTRNPYSKEKLWDETILRLKKVEIERLIYIYNEEAKILKIQLKIEELRRKD